MDETDECGSGNCESSDCSKLFETLSPGFLGFSGSPAITIADCSWDWFRCTKTTGYWPDNKKCCKKRFDTCYTTMIGYSKSTWTRFWPFLTPLPPPTVPFYFMRLFN